MGVIEPAPESFLSAYQTVLSYISSSGAPDTAVTSAFNRMYIKADWNSTVRQSFRDLLSTYYGASAVKYFSSAQEAADEINNDVANATNNRITSLVDANTLLLSPLVLVSALYFKADWKYAFDKDGLGSFLTQDGEKSVEMMKLTDTHFSYTYMGSYDVMSIPYADEDYCMLIIRPVKRSMDAVAALRDSFDAIDIDSIVEQMSVTLDSDTIDITMPRFTVRTDYGLSGVMAELGIREIFSPDADFRGVFQTQNGVYVSGIIHKVFMEVNENGTEAAGAAAVVFAVESVAPPSPQFVVDRPFFAVVYNKAHKINMFTAYIGSP